MMDYRSFQSYYVERGIKGARNLHELDRYLKRAKVRGGEENLRSSA